MNQLNKATFFTFCTALIFLVTPYSVLANAPSEEAMLSYLSSLYAENQRAYRLYDEMTAENPNNFAWHIPVVNSVAKIKGTEVEMANWFVDFRLGSKQQGGYYQLRLAGFDLYEKGGSDQDSLDDRSVYYQEFGFKTPIDLQIYFRFQEDSFNHRNEFGSTDAEYTLGASTTDALFEAWFDQEQSQLDGLSLLWTGMQAVKLYTELEREQQLINTSFDFTAIEGYRSNLGVDIRRTKDETKISRLQLDVERSSGYWKNAGASIVYYNDDHAFRKDRIGAAIYWRAMVWTALQYNHFAPGFTQNGFDTLQLQIGLQWNGRFEAVTPSYAYSRNKRW